MAADVLSSNLKEVEKRDEMLKIADRMSKLRDPDRIYQAERAIRGARDKPGGAAARPALTDAPKFDRAARPITARRGRPPKRSLLELQIDWVRYKSGTPDRAVRRPLGSRGEAISSATPSTRA
jgi:hypothetical protein